MYSALWTHLISRHADEAGGWKPFAWMMDLTSGSRNNPALRRAFEARGGGRELLGAQSFAQLLEGVWVVRGTFGLRRVWGALP